MIPRTNWALGPRARLRRAGLLLIASGLMLGALASPGAAQDGGARVEVLEVSGILDRTVASFVTDTLRRAEQAGSALVVIQLDASGGLGVSLEDIAEPIASSTVPVAVWVGPPGAQALGAGAVVAHAAHVLALSPGAVIGAASPVDLGAEQDPEELGAQLHALAELRGRDTAFAEAAARDSAVVAVSVAPFDDAVELPGWLDAEGVAILGEAELIERGIADFVATTLPDVLREIDGREIVLGADDLVLAIDPEQTDIRFHNLGLVARVLHTAANPVLAYLLVIAGALALVFEMFQPGFGVAGITGAALLALGLYGLAVLPVSWLAFAVLAVGILLLSIDLAVAGFGVLTATGGVALAAGSLLLFTGPEPLRAPIWLIAITVASSLVFFVVVMTTVLRAQASPAPGAAESLLGQVGVVRSVLNPEGHVFVSGALWRARAPDDSGKVRTGTRVRVVQLDDSGTLHVEEIDADQLEKSAQT